MRRVLGEVQEQGPEHKEREEVRSAVHGRWFWWMGQNIQAALLQNGPVKCALLRVQLTRQRPGEEGEEAFGYSSSLGKETGI